MTIRIVTLISGLPSLRGAVNNLHHLICISWRRGNLINRNQEHNGKIATARLFWHNYNACHAPRNDVQSMRFAMTIRIVTQISGLPSLRGAVNNLHRLICISWRRGNLRSLSKGTLSQQNKTPFFIHSISNVTNSLNNIYKHRIRLVPAF